MNSNAIDRIIPRIQDSIVLSIFSEISDEFRESSSNIRISVAPRKFFNLNDVEDLSYFSENYDIEEVHIDVSIESQNIFKCIFRRKILSDSGAWISSPLWDSISINWSEEATRNIGALDLAMYAKRVNTCIWNHVSYSDSGKENSDSIALRELIVSFGNLNRDMSNRIAEKLDKLEEEKIKLNHNLEIERKKISDEKLKFLDEIEKRKEELEIQSHMSERRKLRQHLADTSGKRSEVPMQAKLMRWSIFYVSIIISMVSGLYSFENMSIFSKLLETGEVYDNATGILILVRGILSSLLTIASLVYAANWLRGFYRADIEAFRESDSFNKDINRASWIIETVLEVQHEKKGDLPEEWIKSVTEGLFSNKKSDSVDDESIRALQALLGVSASATFGPNGSQIELGKRGAKRLAKAPIDNSD